MPLTDFEINEVKRLRGKLTNIQLFNHINAQRTGELLGYTSFRMALYKLQIYKCKMLRWTDKETEYLLKNYQKKGNIEIAKFLSKKERLFTKKNINKKMNLLNIKRTPLQLEIIKKHHTTKGVYRESNIKRWEDRKVAEGKTKVQVISGRPQVSIKVNGKLHAYARIRYAQLHGEITPGQKIYFKDMNPLNVADDNLVSRKGGRLSFAESVVYRKNCQAYLAAIQTATPIQLPPDPPTPKQPNLIAVRVNARTVIHVKPGTNIEKLKERFAQRTMIN